MRWEMEKKEHGNAPEENFKRGEGKFNFEAWHFFRGIAPEICLLYF